MRFRILALALCLVMLLVLMPMATFAAEGTDGLVSVSASKSEVNVGDTLVLTFKVNAKTDPLGSINFTVNLPAGLEYVSDEQLHTTHGFLMGAYTPSTGVYGCAVTTAGKSGEFEILKLTVKVVAAGNHQVGVTLGNMSKVDGSTMMNFGTVDPVTVTAKAPAAVKDGSVSVSADKSSVNVGDTLVLTFKIKADTDPLGSINFTVNLPAGLEYVSDEQLHTTHGFLMGAYTPSTGVYGCAVTTAGKSGEFEILKLTVKAVTAGDHVVSVTLGNMSKVDGSTMMDFGTVAPITIRATGAAHTCQHDHYNTTETTHQSVCACGQTIGEAAGHTGGTATCNAKAKCEICESEYGEVDKKNHVGQTEIRDAVTPSCNKPGYSGDTYCKSCNEKIADGREIAATGEHKGGTATCVAKATCEVCGQSYGDVNKSNHVGDTEVRDAVKETCGKPGYSGDTYCKSCNEKIADGREIAATGDHKGGTATCIHKATCEVCGLTYGELDPKNHVGEEKLVDKSEPTCVEEGYTGDIWCLSCNEMKVRGQILPATGKHAGTYRFTWDWDANHKECTLVVWFHCNTCNNDIAFKNAKDAGVVTKVATCKETGIRTYTFDLSGAELPGNCTWDNFVLLNNDLGDKDAAWNYQAKVMTLNVVLPIDPNNHVGETEIRGAVKETCGDPGYTGDTHCKDCGAKIAEGKRIEPTGDHKGGTATCMACAVCEVCGQSYGELDPKNHAGDIIQKELVTKEPTCSEPGKKTVTDFCSKCMTPVNEKEVEIPATGKHTGGEATCMKKAVCEVCGKEYGEKDRENHNWNEKWYQDGKVHWHECDDCHEGRNMKEHYDNDGDKKCDECGYIFGSVPGTGETPVVGIAVAVMFAVACGAVLVIKKRRAVY